MANEQIKRSFLVPLVKGIINLLCLISPYQILSLPFKHPEKIPFWFAEAYVLIRLLVVSLFFWLLDDQSGVAYGLLSIACIFMLSDLLAGTAKIFFIEREERSDWEGHYLLVRDVPRWVMLIFLNLAEIVLYFGVLYYRFGNEFDAIIGDRITAIYQSLLTFATLGYGEIHPVTSPAKILVMFHLVYFIIFVFLVVPVVFSAIRVEGAYR